MGKMMILTFNDNEEMAIKRIIAALSDETSFEVIQPNFSPLLSFPGLEIKQHQHRVLQGGEEISLTRLEYSTLVFLASNPGIVFTRTQIFEAVWNMDSDSCQSNISTIICNLQKKIEPDSKNPTYIKTVLGVGCKFYIKIAGE